MNSKDVKEILETDNIQQRIFTVREIQVILDRDLSKLYGVDLSQMNRQVKRNIDRFPEDFIFFLLNLFVLYPCMVKRVDSATELTNVQHMYPGKDNAARWKQIPTTEQRNISQNYIWEQLGRSAISWMRWQPICGAGSYAKKRQLWESDAVVSCLKLFLITLKQTHRKHRPHTYARERFK